MATLLARPSPIVERERTASPTPPPQLSINTSQRGTPAPIPNKHIPYCSPGPRPTTRQLDTPPASPPSSTQLIETTSLTHPPNAADKVFNDPPVYCITADNLARALDHIATQPLPSTKQVFPWLHGLHAENQLQLAFFIARKRSLRRTPKCIRGLTVVKAGGDLSHSRLKGAIAPEELLKPAPLPRSKKAEPEFIDVDPKEGFSVRNFHIQTCKMATVSDIVVYGDCQTPREEVARLAKRIAKAQTAWQIKMEGPDAGARLFNTFILSDDYEIVECDYPDLIALDSEGCMTGKVMDFFHWERLEMCSMSAPSEIAPNVWLGPTPDPSLSMGPDGLCTADSHPNFEILVECSDIAQMPDAKAFDFLEELLKQKDDTAWNENVVHQLEFPGSGSIMPPTWSQAEVDGLLATCQWIHKQATCRSTHERRDSKLALSPTVDAQGDSFMQQSSSSEVPGKQVLIHCTDGYTESSLLALAYYMYANCVPVHDAWLQMHCDKGRNFFAYASDVHLLRAIQPRLLQASPKHSGNIKQLCPPSPDWLEKMDGSLPSRVLPYMYLGNLGHANNPDLLKEMGIGQILSVGEPINWPQEAMGSWPREDLLFVDKVQDNGVDPLTEDFGRCLEFIENGRKKGTATLVHCRVGVSRSATICIAEVMNELGLSFPRAYCFVRARRLNVIIQPHLRFSYELLKWEEFQCQKRGKPLRRELEWATISREIAAMNKPYSRQG
ncbi:related to dual specificity phosphatase [Ramularia collo-cygni]|uniref:Related to dual specificity phosphatase n=1 Tax=Ramularia collo-cygni TaxID=112498 RepID=A0A2D3V3B9_9PEZI|nr:related to dual specificity phosphatase [Ramularia collo-cygni]CZT14773.1 related to dual specificity phosphatase [Ramularia collo-cygni]